MSGQRTHTASGRWYRESDWYRSITWDDARRAAVSQRAKVRLVVADGRFKRVVATFDGRFYRGR
jgi:hypothetical protein